MNLGAWRAIDRNSGGGANYSRSRMAGGTAVARHSYLGAMVTTIRRTASMTRRAIGTYGIWSIVMDGARREGCRWVTSQTGGRCRYTQLRVAIRSRLAGSATIRIDVAETAIVRMDDCHNTVAGVTTGVVTVGDIDKIRHRMSSGVMNGMAIQTTDGQGIILNDCSDIGVSCLDIGCPD